MAKKKKHGRGFAPTQDPRARVDRAVREGRFQTALELARDLYKQQPTPALKELVQTAYLGRARQLRTQGSPRDALTVLDTALRFAGPAPEPAFIERAAEELAECGDVRRGLALLQSAAGTPAHARLLTRAADVALQQGAAGRGLLPAELQPDFDRILQAFADLEAGRDDAVRAALQGIGLHSPFLEWKVLLRGLLAYYQREEVRALENWQRLNPERLPARLAAPLRFLIDADFRVAQPPAVQTALQREADRLQGMTLVQGLRDLQAALARDESLYRAFRLAEMVLPALRQEGAHLVPRLASCFYWSIVGTGQPEDIPRYQRAFGAPADDPQLARLRALVCEHAGELEEAHRCWKDFERSVAANPAAWPGGQADRVRALVWNHMGVSAANAFDAEEEVEDLMPFGPPRPRRRRGMSPSPETCFENSLKLAPDQLETYESLYAYYQRHGKEDKAEAAARRLLERFPDHAPVQESLADLYMHQGRYDEALELFQKALRTNPLSRQLRGKVSSAHLFRARAYAEAGQFDEARADYRASLSARDGENYPALCKWAACEFKAGNPERAEELLSQALSEAGTRLAIAFNMVIEAIRLKLPRPLKTRFDREFNAALAEPPTGAAAAAILGTTSSHRLAGVTYHGQKTHEKKVLAYVQKAQHADFTEDQLLRVCTALLDMDARRPLHTFTAIGEQRFPANPYFPFTRAEGYMRDGPAACPVHYVQPLLEKARRLAEQMPRDTRQQGLLKAIQEREQMVRSLNPFLDVFGGGFGPPFDAWDDQGGEEDWDDDDTW